MNSEIKFKKWDGKKMTREYTLYEMLSFQLPNNGLKHNWLQYTGLKDKNGVEIFEFCELNNKYRVLFKELKYVLQDISNGDIIDMEFKSRLYEITREYSPI